MTYRDRTNGRNYINSVKSAFSANASDYDTS